MSSESNPSSTTERRISRSKAALQGYLLSIASFFVIIAGLRAAKSLVVTVLLAGFIGILLTPILRRLQKKGVPTVIALLLIIGAVATVGGGVVVVVGQSANELLGRLPYYQRRLQVERLQFEHFIEHHEWLGPLSRALKPKPPAPEDAAEPDSEDSSTEPPSEPTPSVGGDPGRTPDGADASPSKDVPLSNAADPKEIRPAETGVERLENDQTPKPETVENAPKRDADAVESKRGVEGLENDPIPPSPDDPETEGPAKPKSTDEPPSDSLDGSEEGVLEDAPGEFVEPLQMDLATPPPPSKPSDLPGFFSLEPEDGINLMSRLLADLGGIFSSGLLILVTVIFILLEASRFPDKLRAALGDEESTRLQVSEIVDNIRRYMGIKTATSMLTGALIALFLTAYDVRYALLWGLLAFLFNYVPNIGSIIAAGPAVALALVERGVTPAIVTAIGYLVVNCFISYAVEPRFMGEGLGLSTLVVFLSLIFWGWVLGPIGMLLSAPLTMIIKIILADHEETRWIAVMLGSKAPEPPDD